VNSGRFSKLKRQGWEMKGPPNLETNQGEGGQDIRRVGGNYPKVAGRKKVGEERRGGVPSQPRKEKITGGGEEAKDKIDENREGGILSWKGE